MSPIIGITTDVSDPGQGKPLRLDCSLAYSRSVAGAGGIPVLLPPLVALAADHLRLCDGFVFTGGDDPRTETFGQPTHPAAKPVHPDRQAYELALLALLRGRRAGAPVLGVCLGMQFMALHAGGRLNQNLADTLPTAAAHRGMHEIIPAPVGAAGSAGGPPPLALARGAVYSNHHQAVSNPGSLTVLATSPDDVIEAVADLKRRFYIGVQWHPERTQEPGLGAGLFTALVRAARG